MKYSSLIDKLKHVDFDCCYPLYVPSVLRPAHFLYRNFISFLPKYYRKNKVIFLTRKEYYKQYKESQPDVKVEVIPSEYEHDGYGLDTTRKCLADIAYSNGHKRFFDWDDDISSVSVAFSGGSNTKLLRKEDKQKYAYQILCLISAVSEECFDTYEDVCNGSLVLQRPTTSQRDYHKNKLWINRGQASRGANIINVERMKELGIERDGSFDRGMEDLGQCFNVLKKGGRCFVLPSFIINTPDFKINQRTEEILHKYDAGKSVFDDGLDKLSEMGCYEYVRFTSRNVKQFGGKNPCGINYQKWNKDHDTESVIEYW